MAVAVLGTCSRGALTFDATMWELRSARSLVLSASSALRSALGIFANASSVGANTVNGPFSFSMSSRCAVSTARPNVLNRPDVAAASRMVAFGPQRGRRAASARSCASRWVCDPGRRPLVGAVGGVGRTGSAYWRFMSSLLRGSRGAGYRTTDSNSALHDRKIDRKQRYVNHLSWKAT